MNPTDHSQPVVSDGLFPDRVSRLETTVVETPLGRPEPNASKRSGGNGHLQFPTREKRTLRSVPLEAHPAQMTHVTTFDRLRRTKTAEWMIAYVAMCSLVVQLVDVLCEVWNWPVVLQRVLSLVLGLGALPALVVTWYHGERGRQDVCATEMVLITVLVGITALTVWAVCFSV
jgi:hypothetical protein